MKNDNTAIVDEVSQTLTGLIALFDIMTAVKSPGFWDMSVSDFSFFVRGILDNMYQKVSSIKT
jgi:hypothetical protein